MGSRLGPSLVTAFISFHEQMWLNDCPDDFEPVNYRRYVDNTFALFRSPDHLERFTTYLNWKQKNINFTFERERNLLPLFLDILISRSENGFEISVYQKPTFGGVYSNFDSFIYERDKIGLTNIFNYFLFSPVSQ